MNRATRRAQARTAPDVKPLTVLWHSNAPWVGTGYGTQTKQVVERMARDGHAIAVNANYGLQATKMVWEGIPIFPMGMEQYSNDTVRANFKSWTAENPDNPAHCIVLFDAWTMPKKLYEGVPVSIWTMVDHQPIPPAVLNVLQWDNVTPIAVTKFGLDQMHRAGLDKALYIPMAIDTDTYKPTTHFEGQTGRQIVGFDDDHFVVSIINANKSSGAGGIHRKAWAENILAFSIFAQDKPDARLYLHTERFGNYGGLALDVVLKAVGLQPHQYRFVNQHAQHNGIPNEAMAAIYTATDVLLASTLGEGFGLTLLEAQACGTVAVANNFSAQPELMGDGWLTEGQPFWDGVQLAWFNTPNIPSIVDGLEQAYARGRGRSDKARKHAMQYDADKVWAEYWRPYLAHLATPVEPAPVVIAKGAPTTEPRLTIYIPAYRRPEVADLLASLAPQLTDQVEVIVSDDSPEQTAKAATEALADAPCQVTYIHNPQRLGGPANLERGLQIGRGAWLWMISDDDQVLPGALGEILHEIEHSDIDRLILLSRGAPNSAAGMSGTPAHIEATEPGLMIAATLTSANVLRRSALDIDLAKAQRDSLYGPAFAMTTCTRVKVHASPAIEVGCERAGEFVAATKPDFNPLPVWYDLLRRMGIEPTPQALAWNFVAVEQAARV
jgi:glycosyltransferase involved in cell wall biosynthesis